MSKERLYDENSETLRPKSTGAERWLGVPIQCLDHGFVYLVDYLGNDESIVQAARVSYGKGTRKVSDDRSLIRYLLRHRHTTPFEMVEFKFHAKMPIFVARQWIRHRTASVNEYSGRYSEMLDEFYLPHPSVIAKQAKGNRQGRNEELAPHEQAFILQLLKEDYERSYSNYRKFLEMNLAKELARIGLSVANYTQWYWKIDLHNLFHFLNLRLDPHAQYELRVYAEAIAKIVRDAVPLAYEAFEDYVLRAISLSAPEVEFIRTHDWPDFEEKVRPLIFERFQNKRETEEFVEKLKKMNLVIVR